MENSSLVSQDDTYADSEATVAPKRQAYTATSSRPDKDSPSVSQTEADGMPLIRGRLKKQNISERACDIILLSWRKGTTKQYKVYLDRWRRYAEEQNQNPIHPTVANVIEFLTHLYDSGSSYSAINTARSALSAAIGFIDSTLSIGEHPLIKRFVKATYQTRPPLPRYNSTWDVSKVLHLLKTWSPSSKLSLKLLTYKLVMLCTLVTGQRCQSVHMMDIEQLSKGELSYQFHLKGHIKQSKPGRQNPVLVLPSFPEEPRLCVVECLEAYITKTAGVRTSENTKLFLSFHKPYQPVSRSTISRWVKTVMEKSGIDVTTYKPHSTRSASTSAALRKGVPLKVIMKAAGWSTECTFAKFYNKDIKPDNEEFGNSILNC